MAVCLLNQDILLSTACGYSLKQITDLYLANYSDVTTTTIGKPTGETETTGEAETTGVEVLTITMKANAKFYHIEPAKDSATYDDALQVGDGGSKYRTSTVTFNISGAYTPDMVDVIDALSLGRYIIVAKLSDGTYVMFGRLTPMEANATSLQSAAEATGFNGITVTFTNNNTEAPLPLSENAINTVLGTTGV